MNWFELARLTITLYISAVLGFQFFCYSLPAINVTPAQGEHWLLDTVYFTYSGLYEEIWPSIDVLTTPWTNGINNEL